MKGLFQEEEMFRPPPFRNFRGTSTSWDGPREDSVWEHGLRLIALGGESVLNMYQVLRSIEHLLGTFSWIRGGFLQVSGGYPFRDPEGSSVRDPRTSYRFLSIRSFCLCVCLFVCLFV